MPDQGARTPSTDRTAPPTGRQRQPSAALASFIGILASIGASVLAYGPLPTSIRIHWSFGGPYIGPEHAPAWLFLVLFPVLVAIVGLGLFSLNIALDSREEFSAIRPYYGLLTLGIVGMLVAVQFGIILVNL